MNKFTHHQSGFTIIELMVAVALIGVLAAIAIPNYQNYIKTSRAAAMMSNAETLAGFEDTYFYENDVYLAGTYTPDTNGLDALEWEPSGDKDLYKYNVTLTSGPPAGYVITVSFIADTSISVTLTRP